jgi:hypothetical protein
MKASLSYEEVIDAGRPRLTELRRVVQFLAEEGAPQPEAAFARELIAVEASLRQTYGLVAQMARKAESLDEVADIWRRMGAYCEAALQILTEQQKKDPGLGTESLCDLVLDYRLACDERRDRALEEKECLKVDFPEGILPDLS